jgi:hypothetical protein
VTAPLVRPHGEVALTSDDHDDVSAARTVRTRYQYVPRLASSNCSAGVNPARFGRVSSGQRLRNTS